MPIFAKHPMINTMSVGLRTFYSVIVIFLFTLAKGHCQRKLCVSYNFTESAAAVVDVLTPLNWKSVNILQDGTTEVFQIADYILPILHQRGVQTCVTSGVLTNSSVHVFHTTNTNHFLVLGSFVYTKQLFETIPIVAEKKGLATFFFTSEWVTIINEEDMEKLQHIATVLENLAVVVRSQTCQLSLWTLRHVQDDSQMSFVSTLPPSRLPLARDRIFPNPSHGLGNRTPLARDRIFPNPSHGLGNRTLKVTTKEYDIYVSTTTSENGTRYQGVLIDLLLELSHRLNFSYTLLLPPDDSWGQELDNGQWDGPIGMLTRKEADVAMSVFTVTHARSSVADHVLFTYDQAFIIFSYNSQLPNGITFYLQPFQTNVYMLIGGCLLAVLLLLLLLEEYHLSLTGGVRQSSLLRYVWVKSELLIASLLNKPIKHEIDSRAGRVLVLTWLLLSLMLASLYSSQLTSSLTFSKDALPFTSLDELLNQDTYTWGVTTGTALESFLKTTKDEKLERFYNKMLTFAEGDPEVNSTDFNLHRSKVLNENFALFGALIGLYDSMKQNYCDVYKMPETYMSTPIGFYMQMNSPYHDLISNEVANMVDSGLVNHWIKKWSPEKQQCDTDSHGSGGREIVLTDTQTAFYLAVVGMLMAVLVLGIECLNNYSCYPRTKSEE